MPRASSGIDVNRLCIGSEGTLGIITEVTLNVHRVPQRKRNIRTIVPRFLKRLCVPSTAAIARDAFPAMARLNDANKTALSFAFKTAQGAAKRGMGRLIKAYLKHIRRMKLERGMPDAGLTPRAARRRSSGTETAPARSSTSWEPFRSAPRRARPFSRANSISRTCGIFCGTAAS